MVVKGKREIPMYEVDACDAQGPDPRELRTRRVVEHFHRKAQEYEEKTKKLKENGNKFHMLFSW